MGEDKMKRVIFLFFMVMTCYIAGMYRSTPFVMLVVMEGLLLLVMFVWPHYLKRMLTVGFLSKSNFAKKETKSNCRILVRNKGIAAAGRFQLKVWFGYRYDRKKYHIRMFGTAGGYGESQLSFTIYTPYCGVLDLGIERVRFYDYLSLFSVRRKQRDTMQLLVLPKEQAFSIADFCPEWNRKTLFQDSLIKATGNEQLEVRQLREYDQGDDIRRIHWKQSARMQQLWVKEFERETDSVIDFFLELAGEATTIEKMDYFYQIVASILLGLMQNVERVIVHWFETEEEGEIRIEVQDFIGYQDIFFRLYQLDLSHIQEEKEKQIFWQFREKGQEAFRLNRNLEWYYNEMQIIKFSEQNLEQFK